MNICKSLTAGSGVDMFVKSNLKIHLTMIPTETKTL